MGNKGKKLNYLIIIIIVLSLLSGSFLLFFGKDGSQDNDGMVTYIIGNKEYRLLVADEPVGWAMGLMNYRKPVKFEGMLFVFPEKSHQTFWNKNTYLDLDVYWIENEKIVGKSFLPSIETSEEVISVTSPVPVDKVIELIK